MDNRIDRRELLGRSVVTALGAGSILGGVKSARSEDRSITANAAPAKPARKFKLGLVTYNLAPDWDLETIISRCKEVGIPAVEFRTSHKHGIEPTLTKEQRQEVKKRCADGGLIIWSLGSTCEFHSPDPAVVAKNIAEAKRFIELAHDLGARQVKVRPNGLPKEVDEDKTLQQIGESLRTAGEAAAAAGVEIACEVHGNGTSLPPRMRRIMDVANHPSVGVTWNSNAGDIKDGSIKESFALLRRWIFNVHITELISGYPWRELFRSLNETAYERYTMMEIQGLASKEPRDIVRFMRYYKALWEQLSQPA